MVILQWIRQIQMLWIVSSLFTFKKSAKILKKRSRHFCCNKDKILQIVQRYQVSIDVSNSNFPSTETFALEKRRQKKNQTHPSAKHWQIVCFDFSCIATLGTVIVIWRISVTGWSTEGSTHILPLAPSLNGLPINFGKTWIPKTLLANLTFMCHSP